MVGGGGGGDGGGWWGFRSSPITRQEHQAQIIALLTLVNSVGPQCGVRFFVVGGGGVGGP